MKRRQPTQPAKQNWPFLFSVVPGRGVVQNVPAKTRVRIKIEAPTNPQVSWAFTQEESPFVEGFKAVGEARW